VIFSTTSLCPRTAWRSSWQMFPGMDWASHHRLGHSPRSYLRTAAVLGTTFTRCCLEQSASFSRCESSPFASVFCARSMPARVIQFASAGHPRVSLAEQREDREAESDRVFRLELRDDEVFPCRGPSTCTKGDILLLASDGVFESA